MIVAVDAAGGDHYPKAPVEGALLAIEENSELTVLLLGPKAQIEKELEGKQYDPKRVLIQDAPQVIGMEESPSSAVKNKQQSSIVIGMGLHKAGKCHAFVSAGNTGALLAASTFILGKLEGILRPTIGAYYPTEKGFRLLIDAGANLELKPEVAQQFAKMGQVYCSNVLGIENPTFGLLNVGEEEEKGTESLKAIHQHIKEMPGFVGNLEGKDILPGKADVFLTDGLVGNILLKFGESIPATIMKLVEQAIAQLNVDKTELGTAIKILKTSLAPFDYERVGGVPFLGVNGVSIVGHGGSSPLAIKNMIKSAVTCVENDVNGKIVASLN